MLELARDMGALKYGSRRKKDQGKVQEVTEHLSTFPQVSPGIGKTNNPLHLWFMHRRCGGRRHKDMTRRHELFVEIFSMLIGVCLLGVAGIWIFNPLGVKVPVAALVGCVLGAAAGYGIARAILRSQRRKSEANLQRGQAFHWPPHGAQS